MAATRQSCLYRGQDGWPPRPSYKSVMRKEPLETAGCRGGLLFGYFLLAKQEKVTRRKGATGRTGAYGTWRL